MANKKWFTLVWQQKDLIASSFCWKVLIVILIGTENVIILDSCPVDVCHKAESRKLSCLLSSLFFLSQSQIFTDFYLPFPHSFFLKLGITYLLETFKLCCFISSFLLLTIGLRTMVLWHVRPEQRSHDIEAKLLYSLPTTL